MGADVDGAASLGRLLFSAPGSLAKVGGRIEAEPSRIASPQSWRAHPASGAGTRVSWPRWFLWSIWGAPGIKLAALVWSIEPTSGIYNRCQPLATGETKNPGSCGSDTGALTNDSVPVPSPQP